MARQRFFRADWERVCEDWQKSGLNRRAYVRSERYKALFAPDKTPSSWTVYEHLRLNLRRGQVQAMIPVTTLSESDINHALNREPQSDGVRPLRILRVVLGNGTRIEFESSSPERFALQALLVCGGRR